MAHASLHAFDPIALPGGYPNLLPKSDTDRARKSFGGNAERLIKAKRTYDPDNIFSSAIPLPVAEPRGGEKLNPDLAGNAFQSQTTIIR
jgi:hypothetical protein